MTSKARRLDFLWLTNIYQFFSEAVIIKKYRRAGFALIDQSIVSAANFLTIFLFARYMEMSDFGALMLAHTGLLLITNLENALVTQPHNMLGTKFSERNYIKLTRLLIAVQTGIGIMLCVLLGLIGYGISKFHSTYAGNIIIVLGFTILPWTLQEFIRRVLYTKSNSQAAVLNDGLSYGLQFVGAVAAVYTLSYVSPLIALAVLGASSFIALLFGLWQIRSNLILPVQDSMGDKSYREIWSEVWGFGKWLTAQNLVVWFGSNGHAWIVGIILGTEKVGLYRAATHLVNVINPIRQAAFSYLPSRGSLAYINSGITGLKKWVKKTSLFLSIALSPICIFLIIFPEQILHLAYGDRFINKDLGIILALSTVAQLIISSKFPFDIGIMSMGKTKSIFYINLIPVFLLLTLGVLLVSHLGILGVPISGLTINSALLIATYLVYRKLSQAQH